MKKFILFLMLTHIWKKTEYSWRQCGQETILRFVPIMEMLSSFTICPGVCIDQVS